MFGLIKVGVKNIEQKSCMYEVNIYKCSTKFDFCN